MSVEDWAERERDKTWAWEEPAGTAYTQGIVHAFSALLSDEAIEAARRAQGALLASSTFVHSSPDSEDGDHV